MQKFILFFGNYFCRMQATSDHQWYSFCYIFSSKKRKKEKEKKIRPENFKSQCKRHISLLTHWKKYCVWQREDFWMPLVNTLIFGPTNWNWEKNLGHEALVCALVQMRYLSPLALSYSISILLAESNIFFVLLPASVEYLILLLFLS